MTNKTLSERIAECKQDIVDAGLEPEHDIGFQIIEELKEELEKRKAYIVANPCGQCGGIINAIKCQAWKEEADKLKAENKIWQEMVDSTNQTNQALIKRLQENKVDLEKGEVSEVERALEELKNQIVSFRLNFDMDYKPMRYLPDAAQNLINALETEKKPFFKVREEGQFEGLPPSAEALARYGMTKPEPKVGLRAIFPNAEYVYSECSLDDIANPEPKTDIKEECVEPVSIWKDVSELPKILEGDTVDSLIRDKNGNVARTIFYNENGEIDYSPSGLEFEKEYCTLTDFINSFEQMQKDIEELKKK